MIFDSSPTTWQELEDQVCQAFCEMGYESHRNYKIETPRGDVEIDVYAVKKAAPIPTVILCECKYWNKPVDQSVIHGFRSICSDVGAHFGIIISKEGFQSGANRTREATNIHLYDFPEFQAAFFDEWKIGIFMKLAQMTDALMPLVPGNPFFADDEELQTKLNSIAVFTKYSVFFGEYSYTKYFVEQGQFPITVIDPRGNPYSSKEITVHSYRQYYEILQRACNDAREFFGI
jgi:hypothetical protein